MIVSRTLRMKAESSTIEHANFLLGDVGGMSSCRSGLRAESVAGLRSDELFDSGDELIFLHGLREE